MCTWCPLFYFTLAKALWERWASKHDWTGLLVASLLLLSWLAWGGEWQEMGKGCHQHLNRMTSLPKKWCKHFPEHPLATHWCHFRVPGEYAAASNGILSLARAPTAAKVLCLPTLVLAEGLPVSFWSDWDFGVPIWIPQCFSYYIPHVIFLAKMTQINPSIYVFLQGAF